MDSADNKKIVATSIFFGLLLIYSSSRLPDEVVFPGHVTYFIITFYLTYPNSNKLRHLIVTLCLSFGDLFYYNMLNSYIPNESRDAEHKLKSIRVFVLEFFVLFIVVRLMSKKEIYSEFKNSILRTIIFLLEGFFKAKGIIDGLRLIS